MKNKFLSVTLSVVVAFGLWLYVVMVVSPGSQRTYYNIPVILQNEQVLTEQRGLIITSELPEINLTLSGNRTDLNKLDENNINILVDAASIEAAGTYQLNYTVSYPGSVSNNAITRVGQSTNLITVTVEKIASKNVPVKVEIAGAVRPGYIAEDPVLTPNAVKVTGPESVISKISYAQLPNIDLSDRTTTVGGLYEYTLCDAQGNPVEPEMVTTNIDKVSINLWIQKLGKITVTPENITLLHVPQGMDAAIVTENAELTVCGPEHLIDSITVGDITLAVDLNGLGVGTHQVYVQVQFGEVYKIVSVHETVEVSVSLAHTPELPEQEG